MGGSKLQVCGIILPDCMIRGDRMEKELALQILGLQALTDEGSVRVAYMGKLKETNPAAAGGV